MACVLALLEEHRRHSHRLPLYNEPQRSGRLVPGAARSARQPEVDLPAKGA